MSLSITISMYHRTQVINVRIVSSHQTAAIASSNRFFAVKIMESVHTITTRIMSRIWSAWQRKNLHGASFFHTTGVHIASNSSEANTDCAVCSNSVAPTLGQNLPAHALSKHQNSILTHLSLAHVHNAKLRTAQLHGHATGLPAVE